MQHYHKHQCRWLRAQCIYTRSPALAFSLMSTIFLMRTRNSCETWVRYSDSLSSKVSTVTASGHRACMMLPDWGKMDQGTDMCQITTIILQNLEVVTIATMTTVLLPWLQCCYHGCSVVTTAAVPLPWGYSVTSMLPCQAGTRFAHRRGGRWDTGGELAPEEMR